ncbi:hypothetical protein LTS07_005425 [Exophiala sideris]|uniref:Uncharacterized protein n=1 Tax=Exophiala sideris TaxID=1016849 RepID=A0ABR0JB91_9EURO|nr:hypothetical protein LTS07_005425 [Exophiala sideris]KAK5038695.1 hypothetical protein LTR13_004442 [Exophiala sideris]KAK5060576.1 hypothetical protein LTR69_005893 [Exophiala sideris]KAK5183488.1 hypothetical protein LTR44_004489 [Eurotiomycetes sp. CCFEE 6388]
MGAILAFPAILLPPLAGIAFGIVCALDDYGCKDLSYSKMSRRSESVDGRRVTVLNGMGSWADPTVAGAALYSTFSSDGKRLENPKIILNQTHPSYDFGSFDNGLKSFYVTNSGTNPICVAGVAVNTPEGEMALSGNLAKVCHIDNYESQSSVATPDSACVWVDRYGSNGIKVPGLMFDLTVVDEERIQASTAIWNVEDLCSAPFMMEAKLPVERGLESPATDFDFRTQLVKSTRKGNSAVRVCGDRSAIGPDFVSYSERLYCDMDTRNIHPFCGDGLQSTFKYCFNEEMDELVELGDQVSGEKRDVHKEVMNVVKTFEKVQLWT